jgi:RNA polymerase sigma-70 factor (ECF subfamily)
MPLLQFHKNIKQLSDEELQKRFIDTRNQEYLGELYSRYMHLVYGVCLKYFNEPEKAKDAVITLYEKVQTDIVKHQVNNFKSWLYVVTKNYCLMELRKSKSAKNITLNYERSLTTFMEFKQEMHPIDEERNAELNKALMDCIQKLKVEQKSCIHLFYFENKSYREVSDELKLNEKRVKSFIQNGKRNLKICLEKKK